MRGSNLWRRGVLSVLSIAAITASFAALDPAQARHYRRHYVRHHHYSRHIRHAVAPAHTSAYADMVVDANTGHVLHAVNENEPRHPASITKVMTLYLLFEQLEKGKLSLESELPVSAHAASMAPTKLGLRPGSQISVENAIKAIVTKSANDMAVTVAEAIGGSEDHFAEMMTAKAQSLGMTHTHYENASGLPSDDQITTAHDLVLLGRSIQERFPRYYGYFSTHEFRFAGQILRNHNHLMDRIEGMDGIKTGYTRASGFNLLSSVKRGNRRIIAVVMGGASAGARDRVMAGLIEQHIASASTTRGTFALNDSATDDRSEPARVEVVEHVEAPAARPEAPRPVVVASGKAAAPVERARPAVVSSATRSGSDDRTATIPARKPAQDGSTRVAFAPAPSVGRWIAGPSGVPVRTAARAPAPVEPPRETKVAKSEPGRPGVARTGVMIQIGATDEADKAMDLLSRAKGNYAGLASATPFTEKVQKGSETLYRARFAGLSETQADSACKSLKRTGFACFTTRN